MVAIIRLPGPQMPSKYCNTLVRKGRSLVSFINTLRLQLAADHSCSLWSRMETLAVTKHVALCWLIIEVVLTHIISAQGIVASYIA